MQHLRPGVSAAAAAVVDRAVAKDLRQRYPDADSMVADLEEVSWRTAGDRRRGPCARGASGRHRARVLRVGRGLDAVPRSGVGVSAGGLR